MKRFLLIFFLALVSCGIASAQTGSQVTANKYARHDTIRAYINGNWVVIDDTLEFTKHTRWDSIPDPGPPPIHTAFLWYGGLGKFYFRYDNVRHNLDSAGSGGGSSFKIRADGNSYRTDSLTLKSGDGISLSQSGDTVTVTASPGIIDFSGDGSDGDVTISSGTTTLTREMYYDDLTIAAGAFLKPDGFRVFVKDTLYNYGSIIDTGLAGNPGGNGTNGTISSSGIGGTGGAANNALADGYLGRHQPSAGTSILGSGRNGTQSGNATNGEAGLAQTLFIGVAGVSGGAGGNSSSIHTGGLGGSPGGTTGFTAISGGVRNFFSLYQNRIFADATAGRLFRWVGFSGGGGGGAGSNNCPASHQGGGGAGGSAGQPGGIVWISAKYLVGNGTISVSGGKGGNGGNGGNAYSGDASCGGGGGGGGGGGTGGALNLFYHYVDPTMTLTYSGGVGGTGGALGLGGVGQPNGTAGTNGSTGNTGSLLRGVY